MVPLPARQLSRSAPSRPFAREPASGNEWDAAFGGINIDLVDPHPFFIGHRPKFADIAQTIMAFDL
jgi:hypothetical protein